MTSTLQQVSAKQVVLPNTPGGGLCLHSLCVLVNLSLVPQPLGGNAFTTLPSGWQSRATQKEAGGSVAVLPKAREIKHLWKMNKGTLQCPRPATD